MKAKIILNSNLLSKNAILHDFFLQKSNFKNFRFNFDEEKKIQTEIFQNFILQPPKFLFHNGFKHQKWKLHEDLTPIPPSQTQRQVLKVGAG